MDGQWLTYGELAERLGVSVEGARRRVQRGRWPRRRGNDGLARIQIPEGLDLERRPDRAPNVAPNDIPNVAPDNPVHAQIARLERELAGMRDALAETRARASLAEGLLAAAENRAAAADGRAVEEAAKTAMAIQAFERLAERLEAMAEAQKAKTLRRWWLRIVRYTNGERAQR
jgi:hypothetical protein